MTSLGKAGPILVAVLLALPLHLAPRASAFLYWAQADPDGSDREVVRANLDGSGVDQSLVSNPSIAGGLAVDSAHIYWAGGSAIGRVNLDGSNDHPHFITGLSDETIAVAVDGEHIYWTDYQPNPPAPAHEWGTIGRANLDGSGVDRSFITGLGAVRGIAVNGAHIYWGGWVSDRIGRADLDGSAVQTDFIHARNSAGVAVDGAHIYWANGTDTNSIGRANLDGTAVDESFIPLPTYPGSMTVDADHLYWTLNESVGGGEFFRGRIARADIDGTDVNNRFISIGSRTPFGIAVDGLTDTAPPETTITKGAPRKTKKTKVKVKFKSSEPNSTFECKLDKKGWKPCSSAKKFKNLDEGKHEFKVRAIDAAGNVDPSPAKDKFKVVG